MEHEDFLERYMKIKKEEVTTLNSLLNAHFNGEYHFENHPAVVATVANMGKAVIAEVMAVKAPVTSDSGILVIPDDDDDAILAKLRQKIKPTGMLFIPFPFLSI